MPTSTALTFVPQTKNGLQSVPRPTHHGPTVSVMPHRRQSVDCRKEHSSVTPSFEIGVISEPDRLVLVLRGELDLSTAPQLRDLDELRQIDPRPLVLDCSGVAFVDGSGLTVLLDALDRRPHDRLANVPAAMADLLRIIGRHDVLETRARHAVAIATFDGVDVVSAARIAEVFGAANHEGCSYDVVTVSYDPTTCVASPLGRHWHHLVIPPLDAWLGLSETLPIVRWARQLVRSSERVLGVGTGLFLLAATGGLDGHRVAAGPMARTLQAVAPHAVVDSKSTNIDRGMETAADSDGAVALCAAAVADDYGSEIGAHVNRRVFRPGTARRRPLGPARWSS